MRRKAQAALEFLMTYGWALLVVIVAIGALAYFGVLSPQRFLPEKCLFPPGLNCLSHKVTETTAQIVVQNNLGQSISITRFDLDTGGSNCVKTLTVSLGNGDKYMYNLTSCVNGDYDEQFKSDIYITYTDEEGVSQQKIGEIVTKIQ